MRFQADWRENTLINAMALSLDAPNIGVFRQSLVLRLSMADASLFDSGRCGRTIVRPRLARAPAAA
jgi:hypothetical protein